MRACRSHQVHPPNSGWCYPSLRGRTSPQGQEFASGALIEFCHPPLSHPAHQNPSQRAGQPAPNPPCSVKQRVHVSMSTPSTKNAPSVRLSNSAQQNQDLGCHPRCRSSPSTKQKPTRLVSDRHKAVEPPRSTHGQCAAALRPSLRAQGVHDLGLQRRLARSEG